METMKTITSDMMHWTYLLPFNGNIMFLGRYRAVGPSNITIFVIEVFVIETFSKDKYNSRIRKPFEIGSLYLLGVVSICYLSMGLQETYKTWVMGYFNKHIRLPNLIQRIKQTWFSFNDPECWFLSQCMNNYLITISEYGVKGTKNKIFLAIFIFALLNGCYFLVIVLSAYH